MMYDENYKFVGIINPFDIYPDFVYPIFEKNGKYYFQKTNNTSITVFNEIKDNFRIEKIYLLNNEIASYINIKDQYSVGDEAIVAFQLEKDKIIISDIANFISYIKDFVTDDHILIEKIDTLLDCVNRKKNKLKKKILV